MEEENKPTEETTEGEETPSENLSIVEEARKIRDEINKLKEDLKTENDRKEKLQAEDMLAGTGGGNVPIAEPKELTPEEYRDKIMAGEVPK